MLCGIKVQIDFLVLTRLKICSDFVSTGVVFVSSTVLERHGMLKVRFAWWDGICLGDGVNPDSGGSSTMAFLQDMEEIEANDPLSSSAAMEIQCYLWNPTTKQRKELPRFPRYAKALEGKD